MSVDMPEIVVIEGLSFGYGSRSVFEKIDMRVPAGSTFFLGSNGAGKTTLLRILAGILEPSAGEVVVGSAGVMPAGCAEVATTVAVVVAAALGAAVIV